MVQRGLPNGRGLGLCKPIFGSTVSLNRDPEAAHPGGRIMPGGMSDLRRRGRRLVQPGETHAERQATYDPPRAQGGCGQIWSLGLAHVPPHVSFVAGRDRSSDEGATGTDAARLDPDDDECLWTGDVEFEAGGKQQNCGIGAQTSSWRAPK